MLHIVALIVFGGMTYRVIALARRESAAFIEFRKSRSVAYAAVLFPAGPLVMIGGTMLAPLLAILLCGICYLPGFVSARKLGRGLDQAGTDRVDGLRVLASETFATAVGGVLYAALGLMYVLVLANLGTATDS